MKDFLHHLQFFNYASLNLCNSSTSGALEHHPACYDLLAYFMKMKSTYRILQFGKLHEQIVHTYNDKEISIIINTESIFQSTKLL